ncbi:iron uptake transporter permease EfeU [Streptantibioticus parmotrematis]|uniref:iron uptake transporter permease EfeU n=1 Tax=Streptantibioticus parmotrematis TaxID=2873249 RepID=UPI0033EEC72A
MLPTFVIGLREGLEAALIVSMIAAFLRRQGRRDMLRWVLFGVAAAVLLCVGVGLVLEAVSSNLPQRQQEGLETVIGVLAVGMVTYMVIWMRRHSRDLKAQLEGLAADAMDRAAGGGASRAMVLMAFLAVLREGFETVVFLLAAFNETSDRAGAAGGAVAGILVAVALGWGIYRGGVRLNLSRFFRVTGLVLVLVAAGLVVNALHTAHEAGWLDAGQGTTVDLSGLVSPGSVQSALLTGMLGIQPHPVVVEVVGWLVYLVPVGLYVAWPPGRAPSRRTVARLGGALGAVFAVGALVLTVAAPGRPSGGAVTGSGASSVRLTERTAERITVVTRPRSPAAKPTAAGAPVTITLRRVGTQAHAGVETAVYRASRPGSAAAGRPATVTWEQAAALNGGRLPLGVRPATGGGPTVSLTYADTDDLTVWIAPRTGRVVDLRWTETVTGALTGTQVGTVGLDQPVATASGGLPADVVAKASAAARHDAHTLDLRAGLLAWAAGLAVVAALALVTAAVAAFGRRSGAAAPEGAPVPEPSTR